MPGHLLVDAGTVARWGYRTFDALVANDAFLAAEPGLVSRAAEYLARANADYRRLPDQPEWLSDGNYTAAVTAFANLRSTKCTSQQVRQALRQEGYPSVAAQVVDADSYAFATKSQAETLFKQKAIPVDPRALRGTRRRRRGRDRHGWCPSGTRARGRSATAQHRQRSLRRCNCQLSYETSANLSANRS